METAAIPYRVADFLKKHPPFNAMEEGDLLDFARRGRVKFFEANEYIVLQGEPYRLHIFVIQQGTITLWDEAGTYAELRDVRGVGDFIGIEQFNASRSYAYSARSSSEVVLYTFPATDFEAIVLKYPYARQYVSAHSNVSVDYRPIEERREPQKLFLHDIVAGKRLAAIEDTVSIGAAAQYMLETGTDAIAILDSQNRPRTVVTVNAFLKWVEKGGGDAERPIANIVDGQPLTMPSNASLTEGVLAMSASDTETIAITADGTPSSRLQAIVTARDLAPVFGDQPIAILGDIRRAANVRDLRDLNQRARSFTLRYLTSAVSFDWLARFTSLVDAGILKRLVALIEAEALPACWCFCGPAGRTESVTRVTPWPLMILEDNHDATLTLSVQQRMLDALGECGYLPNVESPFEPRFYAATVSEWKSRFVTWVRDPILQQMYRARPLFDLRAVDGRQSLWQAVATTVRENVTREFLYVLANDCLASLPPLTFFQDAVVDESGEHSAVFRLEHSALRPLVDVGRVFGLAAGKALGTSTVERFVMAGALLPERASVFREASDTLRVVLWQQGRIGISQNSDGAELPPALLSRHDRQILKSGFRSILQLLELTANPQWLDAL